MAEQEELLARIEALEKIKHRPFSTWFEWTVAILFLALTFLIWRVIVVMQASDQAINANLDRVAGIVSQLWDIWGR